MNIVGAVLFRPKLVGAIALRTLCAIATLFLTVPGAIAPTNWEFEQIPKGSYATISTDSTKFYRDLCGDRRLGFEEQIRDSHHIFVKEGVEEILNIQPIGF